MTATPSDPTGDTSANDTPETSALETLAAAPEQGDTGSQPPSADTSAKDTGPEDDLRSYLEKKKAERPELAEEMDRIHREFQSQLTPRLQEAAELRKQFEGLDPADAQFLRQVNEMALVNPQAAAQMLENARQQLLGAYSVPEVQAPEEWEFATPMEQRQYQELQELKAWRAQEETARTKADMEQQFTAIGKEFGQEVPYEERQAAARYCLEKQIHPSQIGLVWKGMYGLQQAKRLGRDEASSVIERKSGLHPGPSGITMPPPAPAPEPKTLREALEQAAAGK